MFKLFGSHNNYLSTLLTIVAACLLSSCGTGIEVTEHVTDKDVDKAISQSDQKTRNINTAALQAYADSVPAWKAGIKRLWVADNQARLLFDGAGSGLASMPLAGHVLVYDGYDTGSIYDNRQTVNLKFVDSESGEQLVYRTGKTLAEFGSNFSIPMLIDLDMVDHVARQVAGRDFYIRTPIWYSRENEQMVNGRHFIKVHVDSVKPGNAVMPLRVLFTTMDTREQAMVWMNAYSSAMPGRDFTGLFDVNDPHLLYPTITDKNWELITLSRVVEGMTKEECRLALGSPKRINQNPDQSGMREYWYYDGGSYLYFVDGLLSQFRR